MALMLLEFQDEFMIDHFQYIISIWENWVARYNFDSTGKSKKWNPLSKLEAIHVFFATFSRSFLESAFYLTLSSRWIWI